MVLRRQEEIDTSSSSSYEDNFEDAFQDEYRQEVGQENQEGPNKNHHDADIENASAGRGNNDFNGSVGTPEMDDTIEERFEDEPVLVGMEPSSSPDEGPPPYPPPPPPVTASNAATHYGALSGGSHPQYGLGMDPFAPNSHQHHYHHDPLAPPPFGNGGGDSPVRVGPFGDPVEEDCFEDEPILVDIEQSQGGDKNPSSHSRSSGTTTGATTGKGPRRGGPVFDESPEEPFQDEDSPPGRVQGDPFDEHASATDTTKKRRRGCTRLRCCVLTFLIILLTLLGFFIYHWTKIPKLNEDMETLEAQVQRLQVANADLAAQVEDLTVLNGNLADQTQRLFSTNNNLLAAKEEYVTQIANLEEQVDQWQESHTEMLEQVEYSQREMQIFRTEVAKSIIGTTKANQYVMDALVAELDGTSTTNTDGVTILRVVTVDDISADSKTTLEALQTSFEAFAGETTRLDLLNSNLQTIVGFLNDNSSATGGGTSLEEVTNTLAGQIATNRALAIETLEISSRSRLEHWDCDYRDVYSEEPFGNDFDEVIPMGDTLEDVLAYVDQHILFDLCLSEPEFRAYLHPSFAPDSNSSAIELTSNDVVTAVNSYVSAALEWYFPVPKDGEGTAMPLVGVSQDMWAAAGYQCQNLESQFTYSEDTII